MVFKVFSFRWLQSYQSTNFFTVPLYSSSQSPLMQPVAAEPSESFWRKQDSRLHWKSWVYCTGKLEGVTELWGPWRVSDSFGTAHTSCGHAVLQPGNKHRLQLHSPKLLTKLCCFWMVLHARGKSKNRILTLASVISWWARVPLSTYVRASSTSLLGLCTNCKSSENVLGLMWERTNFSSIFMMVWPWVWMGPDLLPSGGGNILKLEKSTF